MVESKVSEAHSFRDGKIYLYKLSNRPKGLWLARIKVPQGKGYKNLGTGTSDLFEARKFAEDTLDDFNVRVRMGQSLTALNINRLADEYDTHIHAVGAKPREEQTLTFLRTYAVPYFSKNRITDLNRAEIERFFDWRRQNGVRKIPSEATIAHETSIFSSFLKWCHDRGLISKEVKLGRPKHPLQARSHFELDEWRKLTRFMREWVKQGKSISRRVYRDRIMVVNFALIVANTGLRPGEALHLRWHDIDEEKTEAAQTPLIILTVRKGKTGKREVVARMSDTYLKRIYNLRSEEMEKTPSKEDFIFCHENGARIRSFKKGFSAFLSSAGLEFDKEGNRRVPYSLRHTYATFRLSNGTDVYQLAKNMGTGVKMIEVYYGHTTVRQMAHELTKTRTKSRSTLPWSS